MKKSEMMLEWFLDDIKRLNGRYLGVDGVEPEINYSSERFGASLTIRYTQRDENMVRKIESVEAHERERKHVEEDKIEKIDTRLRACVAECGGFGVATISDVARRLKRSSRTVRNRIDADGTMRVSNCIINGVERHGYGL